MAVVGFFFFRCRWFLIAHSFAPFVLSQPFFIAPARLLDGVFSFILGHFFSARLQMSHTTISISIIVVVGVVDVSPVDDVLLSRQHLPSSSASFNHPSDAIEIDRVNPGREPPGLVVEPFRHDCSRCIN